MSAVAEGKLQIAEQTGVGGIDQGLGHLTRGLLDVRQQLFHQGTDAIFTIIDDR